MTDYAKEARDLVIAIGGGRPEGDTYERMLWRVVQKTGLRYPRVWSYFYRKVRRPLAEEMDLLREAREREQSLIKQRWAHVALDNEWAEEVADFERLAGDVDTGAVRRGDATAMPLAPEPNYESGKAHQALGRVLDAKTHRVGAR